jgi:hypothetical protein
VGQDRIEAGLRRDPFVPDLRITEFHIWPLRWIDQNAAIRIEQSRVDIGKNFQTLPILEIGPGSAISQRIGVDRGGLDSILLTLSW